MTPITYQVVGEEEYALKIIIEQDGSFVIHSGTYATQPPRKGSLNAEQRASLLEAVQALGTPRAHPMPTQGHAFEAQLTVGAPGQESTYVFWEGALEEDPDLNDLIRQLERL
jgi:hypothetical protein